MQRLTIMTIGAILVGLAGFAYDSASAQTPAGCSPRAVDIYFDPGSTAFNPFSRQLVERIAHEARACGSSQVVVSAAAGERAQAVSQTLQTLGVRVIVVRPPLASSDDGTVAGRAVTLKIASLPLAAG